MGNRAIITLKKDHKARSVYVHWNGGAGSVAAMLRETKRRMGDRDMQLTMRDMTGKSERLIQCEKDDIENECTRFYAIFYGVAREAFGYCGPHKDICASSVYMSTDNDGHGYDNGAYMIEEDFTCSRIDTNKLCENEANNYKIFEGFYDRVHSAMLVTVEAEITPYEKKNDSSDIIREELATAETIAHHAAARVARIQERLKAIDAAAEIA